MTQPRFSLPRSKTCESHPGSQYWLTMTTPIPGCSVARRAATRTPSSVPVGGIRTSVTTTSGRVRSIAARSVGSSSAIATRSMFGDLVENLRQHVPDHDRVISEYDADRHGRGMLTRVTHRHAPFLPYGHARP